IHPTHALYSEQSEEDCIGSSFDACEEIPPGSSWVFIFNETGSWGYHNHLEASHRGTIVVTQK
ncbi:MAG: hypothetical protein Q8R36_02565, partial [bacterium]|nr:hypothetical protein [bacterium]